MIDPGGRVVMLSGATGGIGAAITRRLSDDGYRLSLGVRNIDAAREAFPGLEAQGGLVCRFDAGEAETAKAWVDATAAHFGRIDVLINNAGVLRQVFFDEGDEDLLDELWTVNVKAPFRLIRHALPHLSETGGGRIINVGSTDAKRYRAGVSVGYAMSKHALMAMSHAAKAAGWEHPDDPVDSGCDPGRRADPALRSGGDRRVPAEVAEQRVGAGAGGQYAPGVGALDEGGSSGPPHSPSRDPRRPRLFRHAPLRIPAGPGPDAGCR
jgi:NADP-dependent 3-hydroxy acid dehydrogenase YdfG